MRNREKDTAEKAVRRQAFLDAAFSLFVEKGIDAVSLESVAGKSGYGIATLYRHFSNKLNLVIELGTRKWEAYIADYNAPVTREMRDAMSGTEYLKFFLDSFLDLYRNHRDILRFNYDMNSFLAKERPAPEQVAPYLRIAELQEEAFHEVYTQGMRDGTLDPSVPEETMFSVVFHMMLAAATRYAVGLVYLSHRGSDPEAELVLLENMILKEFST